MACWTFTNMTTRYVRQLKDILNENGLSIDNVSCYVANNASVNFGKHNSVSKKLKDKNPQLTQCGCKCHVIHNCLKNGMT